MIPDLPALPGWQTRRGRRLIALGVATLTALPLACGCRSRRSPAQPTPSVVVPSTRTVAGPGVEQILLTGSFERVSRAVTGTASIVRRGTDYFLLLSAVTVAQAGQIRVYLVGDDGARSTRIFDETALKYDMAPLEQGVPEQRIALPSQPDASLRSVVLFYPAFGVNLAVAPLHPQANGP
jgi:hypothetical protein